jgi:hypothetical protein
MYYTFSPSMKAKTEGRDMEEEKKDREREEWGIERKNVIFLSVIFRFSLSLLGI